MAQLEDPGFKYRKPFVEQLATACASLEAIGEGNLGSNVMKELMKAMRKIDRQFVENEECDASVLFNRIIDILNDVGDRSAPLSDIAAERPNNQLMVAQDERISEGRYLRPLAEELADQRIAHRAIGYD